MEKVKEPLLALLGVAVLAAGVYFMFFRGGSEEGPVQEEAAKTPPPVERDEEEYVMQFSDGHWIHLDGGGFGGAFAELLQNEQPEFMRLRSVAESGAASDATLADFRRLSAEVAAWLNGGVPLAMDCAQCGAVVHGARNAVDLGGWQRISEGFNIHGELMETLWGRASTVHFRCGSCGFATVYRLYWEERAVQDAGPPPWD